MSIGTETGAFASHTVLGLLLEGLQQLVRATTIVQPCAKRLIFY